MNQDFYSFCQEPDPLQGNGSRVFEQLVASSELEGVLLFDGGGLGGFTARGDLGGGLDSGSGGEGRMGGMSGGARIGGLAMGDGDESEGIEAGQILQALSAAEEGGTGMVLGMMEG